MGSTVVYFVLLLELKSFILRCYISFCYFVFGTEINYSPFFPFSVGVAQLYFFLFCLWN